MKATTISCLLAAIILSLIVSAESFSEGTSSSSLYPIHFLSSWGYINRDGKVVIEPRFEEVRDFHENFAAVKLDGLWGFISSQGSLVIKPQFLTATDFSHGLAWVKRNDTKGWVDTNGQFSARKPRTVAGDKNRDYTVDENEDGKWGFIGIDDSWVIPAEFDDADSFSEGRAAVMREGKWGYIDFQGNIVVPCIYDRADAFSEGFAVVSKNGSFGAIDSTGKVVVPITFPSLSNFQSGLAAAEEPHTHKWGFVNSMGTFIVPPRYDKVDDFTFGFAGVSENGLRGLIDAKGNVILPSIFEKTGAFDQNILWYTASFEATYIDPSGRVVWSPLSPLLLRKLGILCCVLLLPAALAFLIAKRGTRVSLGLGSEDQITYLHKLRKRIRKVHFLFLALFIISVYELHLTEALFTLWGEFITRVWVFFASHGYRGSLTPWGSSLGKTLTLGGYALFILFVYIFCSSALQASWYQVDATLNRTDSKFSRYSWRIAKMSLLSALPFFLWGLCVPFLPSGRFTPYIASGLFLVMFVAISPLLVAIAYSARRVSAGPIKDICDNLRRTTGVSFSSVYAFHFPSGKVANAMVTGILPFFRRVFVSDYLVEQFTPKEVEAVLAHELGHVRHHHLLKRVAATIVIMGLVSFLIWSILDEPWIARMPRSVPMFLWLIIGIPLFRMLIGRLSRKHEFEADAFSAQITGDPLMVAGMLQKLYTVNAMPRVLARLEKLLHTHPTLDERVSALMKIAQQ